MNYLAIFDYKEGFSNVDAYVIHLKRSHDRMENIRAQQAKISIPITIVDAVDGKELVLSELVKEGVISESYYQSVSNPSVYGCYLSHANLLRRISKEYEEGSLTSTYSLIMEDDVQLLSSTFMNELNGMLLDIESKYESFDIMLLGHSEELVGYPPHQGHHMVGNVYRLNPHSFCIGLYTYVVKNASLSRWIDQLHPIKEAIDWQIMNLARNGTIQMLVASPVLTDPGQMKSTINE